jgi:Domain of unknown function (DUF4118)
VPDRVVLTGSRSIRGRPGGEKRMPSPSSTGSTYTRISSTRPRCRHWAATSAPRISRLLPLAVAGPALIGLVTVPFRSSFGLAGGLFCTMLVVVAVAVAGGMRPAFTAVAAGVLAGAFFLAPPYNSVRVSRLGDGLALVAFALVGTAVGILVNELARLGEQQSTSRLVEAALRRVATIRVPHGIALIAPADIRVHSRVHPSLALRSRLYRPVRSHVQPRIDRWQVAVETET